MTVAGAVFGDAVFGAADGFATVGGASPAFFSLTLRTMDGSKLGSGRGRGLDTQASKGHTSNDYKGEVGASQLAVV